MVGGFHAEVKGSGGAAAEQHPQNAPTRLHQRMHPSESPVLRFLSCPLLLFKHTSQQRRLQLRFPGGLAAAAKADTCHSPLQLHLQLVRDRGRPCLSSNTVGPGQGAWPSAACPSLPLPPYTQPPLQSVQLLLAPTWSRRVKPRCVSVPSTTTPELPMGWMMAPCVLLGR